MNFHEVRFPTSISNRSMAGSERRTQIVALGSGHEERNSSWANSRRLYDAGYGVRSLDDLYQVVEFFEERRGRLYGFRWKDRLDCKSCKPSQTPAATDQVIGAGDGSMAQFQLCKTYGGAHAPWRREVKKPVAGSVRLAVDGQELSAPGDFSVDDKTGIVTFASSAIPAPGALVTAGFEFDAPVRFDDDVLKVNLEQFDAGQIPSIPIREIRL
jgi:uncharacterized protein (TIGR02217 family)